MSKRKPEHLHWRCIEEYLRDRGWKRDRIGLWSDPKYDNAVWTDRPASFGEQLRRDSRKGYKLAGITLERV